MLHLNLNATTLYCEQMENYCIVFIIKNVDFSLISHISRMFIQNTKNHPHLPSLLKSPSKHP